MLPLRDALRKRSSAQGIALGIGVAYKIIGYYIPRLINITAKLNGVFLLTNRSDSMPCYAVPLPSKGCPALTVGLGRRRPKDPKLWAGTLAFEDHSALRLAGPDVY